MKLVVNGKFQPFFYELVNRTKRILQVLTEFVCKQKKTMLEKDLMKRDLREMIGN